jgi:hypothetical protein
MTSTALSSSSASGPTCRSVAAMKRRHVKSYKLALASRPGKRGNKTDSAQTIRHNLGMLRTFFERVIDWDYPDTPRRVPISPGTCPRPTSRHRSSSTIPPRRSSWPPSPPGPRWAFRDFRIVRVQLVTHLDCAVPGDG